jgi:NTE family protein
MANRATVCARIAPSPPSLRSTATAAGLIPLLVALALCAAGCAHYSVNARLEEVDPDRGYRFTAIRDENRSDSLLLLLAFSGGGTRAAALSHGVLEQLSKTKVLWEGRERRLLDEVDWISAVSGGSFTAAYYAVHREGAFEDFEARFLDRNFQGRLLGLLLSPVNWVRLASPHFDRSDLAAEYYDRHLFQDRTFGDLLRDGRGPFLTINATDMELGFRFEFTQEQFDLLCSDLSTVPVSRAVAASSSYPGLLTPITLRNYGGTCGNTEPEWMKAPDDPAMSDRRRSKVLEVRSYRDSTDRRYIHLLDGGLADNLGVRGFLDAVISRDSVWQTMRAYQLEKLRKVVLIVVNASVGRDYEAGTQENAPGSFRVVRSAMRVPINRYSFEMVELFRDQMEKWREEIQELRRAAHAEKENPEPPGAAKASIPEVDFHIVEVNFNALPDDEEHRYFNSLPTNFKLPPDAVDRLREVGGRLLRQSSDWKTLLQELHGSEANGSPGSAMRFGDPK